MERLPTQVTSYRVTLNARPASLWSLLLRGHQSLKMRGGLHLAWQSGSNITVSWGGRDLRTDGWTVTGVPGKLCPSLSLSAGFYGRFNHRGSYSLKTYIVWSKREALYIRCHSRPLTLVLLKPTWWESCVGTQSQIAWIPVSAPPSTSYVTPGTFPNLFESSIKWGYWKLCVS